MPPPPTRGVAVTALLVALGCGGFAVVNVVFEITDHFAAGRYADYAGAFTVMNWLVTGLKVLGAVVALLSLAAEPRIVSKAMLTVLLWGGFGTLSVYTLGSLGQAIGMMLGLAGSVDQIDLAGVGYVLFFAAVSVGYGILAVSYSRRHRIRRGLAVVGVLGAPLVLVLVLVAVPALLSALGLMPSP
jgi:hypothetical protein